jgi:hypothetical protein
MTARTILSFRRDGARLLQEITQERALRGILRTSHFCMSAEGSDSQFARQSSAGASTMRYALRDSSLIRNWHPHVYFDAESRQEALQLRQAIEMQLAGKLEMGRFHEVLVGPGRSGATQLGIATGDFARVRNAGRLRPPQHGRSVAGPPTQTCGLARPTS